MSQIPKDILDTLYELSQVLNTGLDRTTLGILTQLCEAGVNPEALAQVVKEMGVEARAFALAQSAASATEATASLNLGSMTSSTSTAAPVPLPSHAATISTLSTHGVKPTAAGVSQSSIEFTRPENPIDPSVPRGLRR